MKTVRYIGEGSRTVPAISKVVAKGDVIEVPDDFESFGFEAVTEGKGKKEVSAVKVIVESPAIVGEPDATEEGA